MTLAKLTPTVSLLLLPLLIAPPGWSQIPEPSRLSQSNVLQVKVVDSDGAQIAAGSRSSKGFSLQVTDGSGAGIPDAAVAVRLPDSGASGMFADGSHSAVAYTDGGGIAHVEGIVWNATPGAMVVRVTATKGDEHAGILLDQSLVAGAVSISGTLAAPRLEASKSPASRVAVSQSPVEAGDEQASLNTIATPVEAVAVRPAIRATAPIPGVAVIHSGSPSLMISNDGGGPAYSGGGINKKKWILIGLTILAGAGAAYAISSMSKSGSTSSGSSSISIGAPSVSVGRP